MTKLERAVRLGLKEASGKSMDEAVAAILECLSLVLDTSEPERPVMPDKSEPAPPPRVATTPPVSPAVLHQLEDLAPIDRAETQPVATTKVRQWHAIEELQSQVMEQAPPVIEVFPEGRSEMFTLQRTVTQLHGTYPGVSLAYRIGGADDSVPYPKATFWTTEEQIDIAAAVEKMKQDATKMYRARSGPIRQGIAPSGGVAYKNYGEV